MHATPTPPMVTHVVAHTKPLPAEQPLRDSNDEVSLRDGSSAAHGSPGCSTTPCVVRPVSVEGSMAQSFRRELADYPISSYAAPDPYLSAATGSLADLAINNGSSSSRTASSHVPDVRVSSP
ncbi:hypothetical protein V6N11_051446 [Hibiscus sabdariffa]|uniref:Uncharacterized protein n=1 Tax=Hibiscus sabdariffa TaxID=183260 RepID=A0ABR2U739_9ROSI